MKVPSQLTQARRHRTVLASTVLVAVAFAGCSDDGDDATATPTVAEQTPTTQGRATTTRASVSTTTEGTAGGTSSSDPSAEEQEVIDRYVGFWAARTAANTGTPDPNAPGLAEFATGEQLDAVVAETQANLDSGLAFRQPGQPANVRDVRVISIDGDSAVVQECVVDDGLVVRRHTGEVVDDSVTTQNVRGELLRVDGRWRLRHTSLIQSWEGVAGCAVPN